LIHERLNDVRVGGCGNTPELLPLGKVMPVNRVKHIDNVEEEEGVGWGLAGGLEFRNNVGFDGGAGEVGIMSRQPGTRTPSWLWGIR
jgi:hypothetical protein